MKNKELAYDYIHRSINKDVNVDEVVRTDDTIPDQDKEELLFILGTIKSLYHKSVSFNESQQRIFMEHEQLAIENMKNTYETIISIKSSLQDVLKDAKYAYKFVLWMYVSTFLLGIGLIVTAIVFAAMDKPILAAAFGAVGLIDIVVQFMYKPPLELQTSRSNLAQLMITITNWFTDLMNLNGFMAQRGDLLTLEELERISQKQHDNTERMLGLIEKYSEPSGNGK
jgi:hypothetical protein